MPHHKSENGGVFESVWTKVVTSEWNCPSWAVVYPSETITTFQRTAGEP
jgi:hypothetical protein